VPKERFIGCMMPYIEYLDGECCLDDDANRICDDKEPGKSKRILIQMTTTTIGVPSDVITSTSQRKRLDSIVN